MDARLFRVNIKYEDQTQNSQTLQLFIYLVVVNRKTKFRKTFTKMIKSQK